MVVEHFGPRTCTSDVVYWQVRQRGCSHANVPGSSVTQWSEVCTRRSLRLQWRRYATIGGAGNIAAVVGLLIRMLKLLSKMCLMRELRGG